MTVISKGNELKYIAAVVAVAMRRIEEGRAHQALHVLIDASELLPVPERNLERLAEATANGAAIRKAG